jgi:glutathione S-transferase
MLKLYYSPGACAMASHIALEEAGADYETVRIDLKAGEQKTSEYLAINPAGVTPALVADEGVLTENLVIMGYVAQTHPEAKLADNDSSFNFGKMQSFNGFLGASLHPAVSRALFARPPLEGEARDAALEAALVKYRLVEDALFKGPWAMGEAYTVADGYLSVFTRWGRQAGFLDPARFPRLNDHLDRMQARPAVQRVLAAEGLSAV